MYKVDLTQHAKRNLRKLSDDQYIRIRPFLKSLADNPRPHGCRKIASAKGRYRIRVGDYRILYQINDETCEVLIHRIVHRREAY